MEQRSARGGVMVHRVVAAAAPRPSDQRHPPAAGPPSVQQRNFLPSVASPLTLNQGESPFYYTQVLWQPFRLNNRHGVTSDPFLLFKVGAGLSFCQTQSFVFAVLLYFSAPSQSSPNLLTRPGRTRPHRCVHISQILHQRSALCHLSARSAH